MRTQRKVGHVINLSSIGRFHVWPTYAVYNRTNFAVLAISEGLRLETKDIRVTIISPRVVESELASTITDPSTRVVIAEYRKVGLTPDVIARAMAYAIEQSTDVDVNEIILRPPAVASTSARTFLDSASRFAPRRNHSQETRSPSIQ